MQKNTQRIKVYGLDSTREVRARLIEILYERVAYHKDKFVAPILHQEMQAMEVKKNGKVEHSDNSHDDQVFSYLMALYVWYDGKNLAQNWHVYKNTLKTDIDEEIEENDIEDQLEAKEKVDIESAAYNPDSDIAQDLLWIEKDAKGIITAKDLQNEQYIRRMQMRSVIASNNESVRQSFIKETGADSVYNGVQTSTFTILPDSIYNMDTVEDMIEENQNPISNSNLPSSRYLAGNLADFYNDL